ncbi:MAG: UDP-N-acetylglucosamine--N-acetylmuramyl-(pentapeptide) pyrophosphoryl-undecaprenol N-acetylglucosamine transferase [Anaerolineales bacterium]|nr:UDP-N-acetylglucosamine--N-acetylmuramyl-(pentapeptide) pyrophosphoryl-undecaprenol N-acetylglucosamine transferase [Anaerolineales bacterium]
MYPALAVLEQLAPGNRETTLWVGARGGMEAELVKQAGISFTSIPAAGVHGVGLRALPGNLLQLGRGFFAARKILHQFRPQVMFFTGGYVAVPMALAGLRVPTLLYVPDIEPGLALKVLARFADRIAVTAEASRSYFPAGKDVRVSGYPTRASMQAWQPAEAYAYFGFSPDIPTLLVTGGSLGALSLNRALVAILDQLLSEMQIIHLTGQKTWEQFAPVRSQLAPELAARYRAYPYLHAEMGAALAVADLVLSRAGASSIGEYPHFGLPAILVPYPHAWRYQKVNAGYLVQHGAALELEDAALDQQLLPAVRTLMADTQRRQAMRQAMQELSQPQAANSIAQALQELAGDRKHKGNRP